MPANLPPDFHAKEKLLRQTKCPEKKIAILEEMLAIMPKHKGTDKLRADLTRKIKKLRLASEKRGGKREGIKVEKEGAGQIVLIGPPNAGKSQLIRSLTKAEPEVANYPFTTRTPIPGMMPYENIQIQLVELPAVTAEVMEGWIHSVAIGANLVAIVLDLSSKELLDHYEGIINQFERRRTFFTSNPSQTDKSGAKYMRAIIIGNKNDLPDAKDNLPLLKEMVAEKLPIIHTSAISKPEIAKLPSTLFKALKIIRLYPKKPGKKLDKSDPLILPEGSTVLDAARALHKDFAEHLRYARGWGEGIYDGQQLSKDFVLKDEFIIEFH